MNQFFEKGKEDEVGEWSLCGSCCIGAATDPAF